MTEEEALKELEAELAALEQAAIEKVTAEQEQEPEVEVAPEPEPIKTAQPKKSSKKAKKEPEAPAPVEIKTPDPVVKPPSNAAATLYGAARIKAKLNRH